MKVTIRGKSHTFNMNVIGKMNDKEFKEHCLELPIFIQLPVKERNAKIKEVYGEYFGNAKKSRKSKSGSDIHGNDVESDGGDIGAEQSADDGGKDIEGQEDKTEVLDKKLRSEEKKVKR